MLELIFEKTTIICMLLSIFLNLNRDHFTNISILKIATFKGICEHFTAFQILLKNYKQYFV